jgi:DNA-binding transcriptional LysR family regulator
METDRLRWFLAVAQEGGIRGAADTLGVSPGSVSKAMADLESTLGQRLFVRDRRGFSLSEAGIYLRARATELLRVEDDIHAELRLAVSARRLHLFGTEPLLALHLAEILAAVKRRFPGIVVDLRATADDEETRKLVTETPAALAIVTESPRAASSRPLPAVTFGTFVGGDHPLARQGGKGVPVAEVLEHAFVVPTRSVYGRMPAGASADGWRDDEFPRPHRISAPTLALTRTYVESGHAIAYLPTPLTEQLRARRLKVLGCPYSCTVLAHLVHGGGAPGWVRQLV